MALLLLFCGSLWAPLVSPQVTSPVNSLRSTISSDLGSVTLQGPEMTSREPVTDSGTLHPASSAPTLGTPVGTSAGAPVSELMPSKEDSSTEHSALLEVTNGTSGPADSKEVSSEGHPMVTFNSLETSTEASSLLVTNSTSSLETSSGDSGLVTNSTSSLETSSGDSGLVTNSTSSLETSSGDSGLVTNSTSSLETSSGDSGLVTNSTTSLETSSGDSGLVTNSTSSLETSSGDSGPPVTKATSSVDISTTGNRTFVTMTTSFPETPRDTGGAPVTATVTSLVTSNVTSSPSVSSTEVSMGTTPKLSVDTDMRPSGGPGQERKGMLLVPMLVALLVVTVLLALLLLWRRRQKRRTGVLTLSGGGKRNGVVDAWAGPAHVRDEEATAEALGGAKGNKGSGVPEAEGSAQRPTLTTFFSRRRSHQGSLAMEELKAKPGPSLKGEEEPLVGSEDEGPAAGDGAAPRCP